MASNKAAAAAAAGAAVTASSSLQTHTLHDLLFQLKEDVLRNRCVRESGDNGDIDNDEGSENVDTNTGGKRTSTAAAALSDLLLRNSRRRTGHYSKRRRSDDRIPSVEADREASEATTVADGGGGGGDDDDCEREQQKRRYRRLRDECRADLEKSRSFHEESIRKIRELREVYLHGLRTVADLQNLREAPDAILPGNFPAAAFAAQGDATKKEPTTRPAPR
jgi:hypothetical protein